MRKFNVLFILQLLISVDLAATECIGPNDAKNGVVYLHGMDTSTPSSMEVTNRTTLTKISNELEVTIALPRAKDRCPTQPSLHCWGWNFNDAKIMDSALASVQAAKDFCFPKAKNVGLVGFSNGGYVVNYALKSCKKSEINWSISIGAASTWKDNEGPELSNCGKYIFMAGSEEEALHTIKKMIPWLTKRKVDFDIMEFPGGHTVPYKELKTVIQTNLTISSPFTAPR